MRALRVISAATLVLSLLATIAPFGVLSSAHVCTMPCCADGACATGACEVEFEKAAQTPSAESHCEETAHENHLSAHANTDSSDELCGADNLLKSSVVFTPVDAPLHHASLNSVALTKPCPPECGAGAGAYTQLRRSREHAILSHDGRPRPPTSVSVFNNESLLTSLKARWRRHSPTRAPPICS